MWSLLLNKYVLGALGVALVIGGLAYVHSNYVDKLVEKGVMAERAKWTIAIDKQKAEAKGKLEEVRAANAEEKRKNIEDNQKLEDNNAKLKANLVAARTAAKSAKLRDPGAKGCGDGGGSSKGGEKGDTSKPTSQDGGGELSPAFTEFLIGEANRADEVALVANTCLSFIHGETL